MIKDKAILNCCCSKQEPLISNTTKLKDESKLGVRKILNSIYSVVISLLIGLFPKCPACWAAYLSIFGSYSISKLPYMPWLMPIFLGFLGLHLYLIFRKIKTKGMGPFAISLLGAVIIIGGKMLFSESNALIISGMICILIGSLWNSFSLQRKQLLELS